MEDQKMRPPARTLLECSNDDQLCKVRTYEYEVIVVPVFLVGVTIILLAIILWLRYRGWKSRRKQPQGHLAQESHRVVSSGISLEEPSLENVLRTKDPSLLALEIPSERIRQPSLQQIGEGRFGPLYKTGLREQDAVPGKEVVIKQLKDSAEPSEVRDFLQRAAFQAWLGTHPHLVDIIGCCSEQKPFCMVLECVEPGSLLQFLWDCRRDVVSLHGILYDITECQVYIIALQILSALEFLQERNLVHGDVAARNVVIQHNFTTKLTGLGGACEMHSRGSFPIRRPTPLKWMAPERLLHLSASSKSDVWSFGILLYELVTLGAPPFPEVPPSSILQHLQRGNIMKRPSSCKQNLYNIMKSCWAWKVSDRISLSELRKRLENGKKTSNDRTVLQVPELVIHELYEGVAGTEPVKMETDYTVL
ncbi:PREDICTED: tyrosine-protein kinase STYK1 [Nanorana parkeri]|uniref:tyrosine-protein kinase STYK1 n=1 Tax=Nanorana parkeri TaxID=125878 RepID=UPI00085461E5|nr:PREDICTED: tyrosine-protein kinase STYK1 [Nanorana parkeri]